jgi:hypothetical protein
MIIFDGTYRWKIPHSHVRRSFRKNWGMSGDLKIIDLTLAQPDVRHLKQYVVVACEMTPTPMKTSVAETLGRRIFRDFGLTRQNVLWMEYRGPDPDLDVAVFTPVQEGMETHYRIVWRPAHENERKLAESFLIRQN